MKKIKGFTIIELLAVIIIIGIISTIAIAAVSNYVTSTKNSSYSLYEKSMIAAAKNKIVDCIKNNENCNLPKLGEEERTFLDILISEGYIENMKDPNSSALCEDLSSYVSVKKVNNNDYDYVACLYCGKYKTNSETCEAFSNGPATGISCGTVSGDSTVWTNKNRTVTVKCVGEGNACRYPSFSKTFKTTTKIGEITIRDRSGNALVPACGNINVYVDKDAPTCEIGIEGNLMNNSDYYEVGSKALLQNPTDTDSGVMKYGIGSSVSNYDFNNLTELSLKPGITQVFGYMKDNAGNDGLCSKTAKVAISIPKIDIYYGFSIYPNESYILTDISGSANNLYTESNNPRISIGNLSKYKNVEYVKIILNAGIPTQTTATLVSGDVNVNAIMAQGSQEITFVVPKGTYDNFQITLGKLADKNYKIGKIEVLTKDNTIWSNQDVEMYVIPKDEGVKTTEVSFDNGSTWTTTMQKVYTTSTENYIIAKNQVGLESIPEKFSIRIDRTVPSVDVVAYDVAHSNAIPSGKYVNSGLNYYYSVTNEGPSGAKVYYCKDKNNTCTPSTEVSIDQLYTGLNTETGFYYNRYLVKTNAGTSSETKYYYAKVDVEPPRCYITASYIYVGQVTNASVKCDDDSTFQNNNSITASSFVTSNNNLTITEATPQISSAYYTAEINFKIRGNSHGATTIKLPANTLFDGAGNGNEEIIYEAFSDGQFTISLDKSNYGGPSAIYLTYGEGWFADAKRTQSITLITPPTNPGYLFKGYFTSYEGAGTKIVDYNGSIVGSNTSIVGNTTIRGYFVECGNGYYCLNEVKTACAAGSYGNNVTTGSTQAESCQACDKGYYCTGGPSKTGCGSGKYNDLTSQTSSSACKNINAGCYGTNGTSACPNACSGRTTYSGAGSASCSTVSTGYYTTGCNSSNNNCTGQSQCIAGYYCTNGVLNSCGGGKYSSAGATSCSTITAGCYGTSATSACPTACTGRTKYSGAGASSCSTVSSGYYTTGCDGSGNKCTGQTKCAAGTYCSNGVSAACTGRTKYSGAGATSCSTVSNGYYTTGCNSSNNNCTGQSQCAAGTYCSNGVSAACTGRTKYSGAGASSCSTVSSGYYTTGCNSSNNNCTGQSQCTAGNYCTNGVSTKCPTYYTSGAGATSCYDNTTPTVNDYSKTMVKNFLSSGTICGLGSDTGSGLKQMEYYNSCDNTHRTATISGDCATVTISGTCANSKFYYRLKDDRNWSGWKNVSEFGAYYLLAKEYNQLLNYNPASNNSDNIGFHVARLGSNKDLGARMLEVGTTAINKNPGWSNTEIVKRFYRGILGREPADSEVQGHVNNLNNGKSRVDVLKDFINSNEAKEKRSKWGYK